MRVLIASSLRAAGRARRRGGGRRRDVVGLDDGVVEVERRVGDDVDAAVRELGDRGRGRRSRGAGGTVVGRVVRQRGEHPATTPAPGSAASRELVPDQGAGELEGQVGRLVGDPGGDLLARARSGGRRPRRARRPRRRCSRVAAPLARAVASTAAAASAAAAAHAGLAGPRTSRRRSPAPGRRSRVRSASAPRAASVTASPSTRSSPRRVQTPVRRSGGSAGDAGRRRQCLRRRAHRHSLRRTMIWPCSSSWRIVRITDCWASSTWVRRTAPSSSTSSMRVSAGTARRGCEVILARTVSLTPLSASASSALVDLAQHQLHRPVVEVDDVLEHEHPAADLVGELRVEGLRGPPRSGAR